MSCQAPRVNDPRSAAAVRDVVRGGARGGCAGPVGDGRRHGNAPRGSVGPDSAPEGGGRAGVRVLHELRESRKGAELGSNPRAALLFHWEDPGRQVRVGGAVERVSTAESDAYFASGPVGSRLGAIASRQSRAARGPGRARARRRGAPRRCAASGVVGRLQGRAGSLRVLTAPRESSPRPFLVRARRRGLENPAPQPLGVCTRARRKEVRGRSRPGADIRKLSLGRKTSTCCAITNRESEPGPPRQASRSRP
jgi:hypothetical protein